VVECGGLENRCGLAPTGGSNPSPSANEDHDVRDYVTLGLWVLIVGGLFFYLWRKGMLNRIASYVAETREELRKCTWPSWVELKGSTVVVMITIALLGLFTMVSDFLILGLVRRVLPQL
jgi:preprotein translocase subunit SecE